MITKTGTRALAHEHVANDQQNLSEQTHEHIVNDHHGVSVRQTQEYVANGDQDNAVSKLQNTTNNHTDFSESRHAL